MRVDRGTANDCLASAGLIGVTTENLCALLYSRPTAQANNLTTRLLITTHMVKVSALLMSCAPSASELVDGVSDDGVGDDGVGELPLPVVVGEGEGEGCVVCIVGGVTEVTLTV
mmetsp:Transcript_60949/g.96742  ORF Transcript_60949/g.96742 Transcript_60949/m.96742 type:complete len:114 (-) Transcript_60949:167-508(-)